MTFETGFGAPNSPRRQERGLSFAGYLTSFPRERVREKTEFIHEGDAARSIIAMSDGMAYLFNTDENGHQFCCGMLLPGDVLMSHPDEDTYAFSARSTATGAEIRRIPLAAMHRAASENPEYAKGVLDRVLKSADRERRWMNRLQTGPLAGRVVSLLTFFNRETDFKKKEGDSSQTTLKIPLYFEEAAMLMNASREKISGVFNQLKSDGLVSYESKDGLHKMTVADEKSLIAYAATEDEWDAH